MKPLSITLKVPQRPQSPLAKALLGVGRATRVHRNRRRDERMGRGKHAHQQAD